MEPRIEILPETKLIGNRVNTSFADNKTAALWRSFMPRRHEIANAINSKLYAVEVYPSDFFSAFNPLSTFEKWAAIAVSDFEAVPDAMQRLVLPSGKYAVFIYVGAASEGEKIYRYIFENWLPQSGYQLDTRPHFALMGERYKHEDPNSEEEIWIPIV